MTRRRRLLALLLTTTPLYGWAADKTNMQEFQSGSTAAFRVVANEPPVPLYSPASANSALASSAPASSDPTRPALPHSATSRSASAVAAITAAALAMPAAILPVQSAPLASDSAPPAGPRIVLDPPPVSRAPESAPARRAARPRVAARTKSAKAAPAIKPTARMSPAPVVASAPERVETAPAVPEPATPPPNVVADAPVALAPPPAEAPTLQDVIGTVLRQSLPPPVPEEMAIQIVAGTDLGVAAYAHDDQVIIVFDQRVPIDPAQLRPNPGGPAAGQVQMGPDSTILTVPWPAATPLAIMRRGRAWTIAAAPDTATPHPMVATPADRRMELRTEQPGHVVTIIDPLDGRSLLIGTAHGTEGGRAFVPTAFRAPEYTLVPSVLGVVIEPLSDTIDLRQFAHGFAITAHDDLTPVAAQAPPASAASLRFDLPALPTEALVRRLQAELAAAAVAPPRARAAPRLIAAQSLISLGFGSEAQALLTLITIEDPAAAADPNLSALGAIAALLAGRPSEAQGLDDPALDGSDEIALWRAVRGAWRDGSISHDAALLPVALGYPTALRARLAPVLADAAAAAGDEAALALIDAASPGLAGVRLAQAARLAQSGPPDAALAILDDLRDSPDRRTATRAGIAAVELRLQHHQLTPAQAADALERQVLAWRGDGQEVALRRRVVALRMEAGSWRAALEGLRALSRLSDNADARIQPGEQAAAQAALQSRVGDVFRAMMAPGAVPIPPLDFVALVSEFSDGLPAGQDFATTLADHLMELDLPLRARTVLMPLLQSTPPGPVRAGIGARVAQLSLEVGNPKEAEAALAASDAPGLPPTLVEQRVLLVARARAAREDRAGAVAQLTGLGTAAADDLRATLLSQAGDWPGALAALNALASKTVPADGPLPDAAQEIVLRQASAAVQSNNVAALATLRDRIPRMDGRRGGLLQILTAPPITGSIDIARAGQELALGRELPGRLSGLAAR